MQVREHKSNATWKTSGSRTVGSCDKLPFGVSNLRKRCMTWSSGYHFSPNSLDKPCVNQDGLTVCRLRPEMRTMIHEIHRHVVPQHRFVPSQASLEDATMAGGMGDDKSSAHGRKCRVNFVDKIACSDSSVNIFCQNKGGVVSHLFHNSAKAAVPDTRMAG